MENVRNFLYTYKVYIILSFCIILIILIGYLLSYKYRVGKKLMNNFKNSLSYQTDYCSENYKPRKLVDFHIKSSHSTALTGYQHLDYISLDMIKKVLFNNVRYLEFEIFSKTQELETEPIVASGLLRGDWKLSVNILSCDSVFQLIADNAFSEKLLTNYQDPLFIYLDIKTKNLKTLDKLANIIQKTLGDRLLDSRYKSQRKNIATTNVCDLMDKVVIMSSNGFVNSTLEEYINISTNGPDLQRLSYSDLIIQKKFNVNKPDFFIKSNKISFHKSVSHSYLEIHDYSINLFEMNLTKKFKLKISGSDLNDTKIGTLLEIDNITKNKISFKNADFKREMKGEEILINGYVVKQTFDGIEDINKTQLTIVIPDYDFFATHFNPKNIWYLGCQFVAMNYFKPDNHLEIYNHFFSKRSLRLKQSSLLNELNKTMSSEEIITKIRALAVTSVNPKVDELSIELEKELNPNELLDIIDDLKIEVKNETNNANYKNLLDNLLNTLPKDILTGILPSPETEEIYDINSNFLMNNMDLDIQLQPYFNGELYLIKNDDKKFSMSMNASEKFKFKLSPSNTQKNAVQITTMNDKYLSVSENDKGELSLEFKDDVVPNTPEFIEKTTFMVLNSICNNSDYISIGYVKKKVIEETERKKQVKVLHYLKYKHNFSIKNKIYKKDVKKFSKIATLNKDFSIWRPMTDGNFKPLGDIILTNEEVERIGSGEENQMMETVVNGGVSKPLSYELVYDNRNKSESDRSEHISIWKPIAPDGFISMGYIFKSGGGVSQPSRDLIYCPRADLVKLAEISLTSDQTKMSRYNLKWYNNKISLWTGRSEMKYFIAYPTIKEDNNPVEPREYDYPIYDFAEDINTDDLIYLDSKINNRESACFKANIVYKSGEFTEYDVINNLRDIKDNDFKAISYSPNRRGQQMCMALPQAYWSEYYNEIGEKEDNSKDTSHFFKKMDVDSIDESILKNLNLTNIRTTKETCDNLGGYMSYINEVRAQSETDNMGLCGLNTGQTNNCPWFSTEEKYYINKPGTCIGTSKIGDITVKTRYADCLNMEGNYSGDVERQNKIVQCGFDICSQNNKYTVKLKKSEDCDKNNGHIYLPAKNNLECLPPVPSGEKDIHPNKLKGVFNNGLCKVNVCYSSGTKKTDLNVEKCRGKDYFGTNFMRDDNTIRLKDNKQYCLTADMDKNTKEPIDNSNMFLSKCKTDKHGQDFNYSDKNTLELKTNDIGLTNNCVTKDYDNAIRLKPCGNRQKNQMWAFSQMPKNFCISKGSFVYYFKKVRREMRSIPPSYIMNTPIANLLQEEYDEDYFHVYIKAKVSEVNHKEATITIKNLNSLDKYLPRDIYTVKQDLDELVLDYTPPMDKLKLGTKVIVKNGGFDTIHEDYVKFFGVITKELKNGNYQVFLSINSIEPDKKNINKNRPDYVQVKEVKLSDIILLKNPMLC
jgi:hypothetical protein